MRLPLFRRRLRRGSLAPGRYLTDGYGLFRVVSRFDDDRSLLIVIEHCITLETYACTGLELEAMGFRVVRGDRYGAAAASAAAGSRSVGNSRSPAASSG